MQNLNFPTKEFKFGDRYVNMFSFLLYIHVIVLFCFEYASDNMVHDNRFRHFVLSPLDYYYCFAYVESVNWFFMYLT